LADTSPEGPFGNHTGFYVEAQPAPIIRVTAITRRRDAIYPCTVVGRPPMEDCYLAKATERLLFPVLQTDFPEIKDLNFPIEGIFHGAALIRLAEEAAGQGREMIQRLWRHGFLKQSRLLVVFNAEVDVHNPAEAYWHAINRVQGDRDIVLDGEKLGLDATVATERQPLVPDLDILELVTRRWPEYGID